MIGKCPKCGAPMKMPDGPGKQVPSNPAALDVAKKNAAEEAVKKARAKKRMMS